MLRFCSFQTSSRALSTSSLSVLSSTSSSPSAAAPAGCIAAGHLAEAVRRLRKQHGYRHERYYRSLKSRRRFSRQWEMVYDGAGSVEHHKTTGHELEAFENFGVYDFDARSDPAFEVATKDLKLLDPRERYAILSGMLEKRNKVNDGRSVMQRLRLTLLSAECFEDLCRFDGIQQNQQITMSDLPETDQYHFRNSVQEVMRMVNAARHDHPDAIAGGMRAVQICANVGVRLEERRRLMDRLRGYIDEMEDGYSNVAPANVLTRMGSSRESSYHAVESDPASAVVRSLRKYDAPGTQYLYPPSGVKTNSGDGGGSNMTADKDAVLVVADDDKNGDLTTQTRTGRLVGLDVGVRVAPDKMVDSIKERQMIHRMELKNYRYLYEDSPNQPLFKDDANTRVPYGDDV